MFTMQTIGTNFLLVLTGKVIQNSRKISKVKISEQKIINSKTILLSLSAVSSILLINAQEKPFKVSKNATFLLCQWLSFSWMHVWITFKNMETRICLIENLREPMWKTRETRITENFCPRGNPRVRVRYHSVHYRYRYTAKHFVREGDLRLYPVSFQPAGTLYYLLPTKRAAKYYQNHW